jgi:thioesterase domain-containing protein
VLVAPINASGTRPPIFFLHGDFSGGGFFSNALARGLGPDQPFFVVHPHGLIDDAVPPTIEAMAEDRLAAVREARPRGPYILGGHCAGGIVALEIARRLIDDGDPVPLVFLIDAKAPWQAKRVYESGAMGAASDRPSRPRKSAPAPADELRGGNMFARYLQVMQRYAPRPIDARLVVLRPEANSDLRPTLGWSAISARAEVRVLRGDHVSSIGDHVKETAATLSACLEDTPHAQ